MLFRSELPEFQRAVLDSLRQPLETGVVDVARANAHVTFPARVQLVAAMNPCDRVAFTLPGVSAKVRAMKPEMQALQGNSLGANLRRRRHELKLNAKQAAIQLGVSEEALFNWERNACEPHVRLCPTIIAFLGREPWDEAITLGQKLLAERRRRGLSVKRAAQLLGVDEATFARWESGSRLPKDTHRATCQRFLMAENLKEGNIHTRL